MAEQKLPKLTTGVRFPSPAPTFRYLQAILSWSVGATIAVVLVFKFFIPATIDLVSRTLPFETQEALGEAVVERVRGLLGARFQSGIGPGGDIVLVPTDNFEIRPRSGLGPLVCAGSGGSAALAELTQRLLDQMAIRLPVRIHVLDFDAVNILPLPGGQILVFSGLFNYAENPEEIAGFLAHNLAHAYTSRQKLIQRWIIEEGVSGLVRVFVGDDLVSDDAVIGQLADLALRTRYSEPVEIETDHIALDLLEAAGINTRSLADFIDRLPILARDLERTVEEVVYRLSVVHIHPPSSERSAVIRGRAKQLGPAMSPGQWADLRRICA